MVSKIRYVSTLRPKHCRCDRPFGDIRTGECVRCGRRARDSRELPPTMAESLWEIIHRGA